MSLLRHIFRAVFLQTAYEPAPEENRLFECMTRLRQIEESLRSRMDPMLEANEFLSRHPSKDPALAWDPQKEDVTVWSFDLLMKDLLQQKNWPTYPQEGQNRELVDVLGVLQAQSSSRTSFNMVIADYQKPENLCREATNFILENVGDLEQIIAELTDFRPEKIKERHTMLFPGQQPNQKPQDPQP